MTPAYTHDQLDALRELANIGSGTAGTALSTLLGRPVDLSIPTAALRDVADAVAAAGDPEALVRAVLLPVGGDFDGAVLLLVEPDDAATLCALLGVDPEGADADSALAEIGNILGTSCLNALSELTGLALEPRPPQSATDLLGAVVASALLLGEDPEVALVLDSELTVEGEHCGLELLLLPSATGVAEVLRRVGL